MPVLKIFLGRQGLIQTKQETCNATKKLLQTLSNKDKHQFNETVKFLQYCKLNRHNIENAGVDEET